MRLAGAFDMDRVQGRALHIGAAESQAVVFHQHAPFSAQGFGQTRAGFPRIDQIA